MSHTSCMIIFAKTYGEETRRCSYKDYSSLNRWQANRDLLSVMMHLCQGKYPPAGSCESRTHPLKMGLLEDSPCRAIEIAVYHVMRHNRVPRASRDLGMSCGHFRKT
jgi:hypothetical protein